MSAHSLSQYQDSGVWILFCKKCSGEGEALTKPCPGKYIDKSVDKKKSPAESMDNDARLANKRLKEGNFISLDELKNNLDKPKEQD